MRDAVVMVVEAGADVETAEAEAGRMVNVVVARDALAS